MHIVTVTGWTAAGKTIIADQLANKLNQLGVNTKVINFDCFYKTRHQYSNTDVENINYDVPGAFDWDLFKKFLEQIEKGEIPSIPHYDFKKHDRAPWLIPLYSSDSKPEVLIIEGIMVYCQYARENIWSKFDTTNNTIYPIFISTSIDFCYDRRLARDTTERGRTHEQVRKQWFNQVRDAGMQHINPVEKHAKHTIINDYQECSQIWKSIRFIESVSRIYTLTTNKPITNDAILSLQ